MTIKSSGSLKMSEINAELGRANVPTNLGSSELRTLAGKASGAIKFSDFYGKSHEITVTLASSNSLVLASLFSTTDWASSAPKRVIIPSGVTIGATTSYAIATSITAEGQAGNFGGTLTLENRGTISGIGGAANSGVGGNAILTSFLGRDGNKLRIENYGTIRAGGGGGGRGGNGGNGSVTQAVTVREPTSGYSYVKATGSTRRYYNAVSGANAPQISSHVGFYWGNTHIAGYSPQTSGGWTYYNDTTLQTTEVPLAQAYLHYYGVYRQKTENQTTTTTGGAGGNGGRGQGFDGAAGTGANGAAGGTNAGAGGKGGNGGGWGATGATGATGANGNASNGAAGATGGLAGFYITAGANVTLVNSGTVQGRLG